MSAVALGTASGALSDKLASSGLPPQALGVAETVNADGGALAVANADLGGLSRTVAPLAREALESGLDLGMYICAGAALAGVVIAALALRHSGAAAAVAVGTSAQEAATAPATLTGTSSTVKPLFGRDAG
jgi:hypothetical protein